MILCLPCVRARIRSDGKTPHHTLVKIDNDVSSSARPNDVVELLRAWKIDSRSFVALFSRSF